MNGGGGQCSPAPRWQVNEAAVQLAVERFEYRGMLKPEDDPTDVGGDASDCAGGGAEPKAKKTKTVKG